MTTQLETIHVPSETARTTGDDNQPIALPDVFRGALDAAGVQQLFADLAALDGASAGAIEVRLKAGAQQRGQIGDATLKQAEALLLDGLIQGVQVIYQHDGQTWFDTVMRRGEQFEVVRMAASRPTT